MALYQEIALAPASREIVAASEISPLPCSHYLPPGRMGNGGWYLLQRRRSWSPFLRYFPYISRGLAFPLLRTPPNSWALNRCQPLALKSFPSQRPCTHPPESLPS